MPRWPLPRAPACCCSGPLPSSAPRAPASRSSTPRSRSPRIRIPRVRSGAPPEASIVQAVAAVAEGRADALVSGGSTGAALAAALFRVKRNRGVHRPALAVVVPGAEGAVPAARRRRQRRGPARAPRPVRAHGRGVHGGRDGRRAAARGAALQRRGAQQGTGGRGRRPRGAARAARRAELRRQRRGLRDRHRRGRRDRGRRLRRQRGAEGDGGHLGRAAGRDPRRGHVVHARQARRPAAAARRCAGCATRSIPRRRAGRCCSACGDSAWSPTARSGRAGSRARSRSRRAACGSTSTGRTYERLAAAGALRNVSEPAASLPEQP